MVDGVLAFSAAPCAAATVKEDTVTHFRLIRAPRAWPELPPADDPDLPVPRQRRPVPDAGPKHEPATPEHPDGYERHGINTLHADGEVTPLAKAAGPLGLSKALHQARTCVRRAGATTHGDDRRQEPPRVRCACGFCKPTPQVPNAPRNGSKHHRVQQGHPITALSTETASSIFVDTSSGNFIYGQE